MVYTDYDTKALFQNKGVNKKNTIRQMTMTNHLKKQCKPLLGNKWLWNICVDHKNPFELDEYKEGIREKAIVEGFSRKPMVVKHLCWAQKRCD